MELKGTIQEIFDEQIVSESFKKREFVVKVTETSDRGTYEQFIKFEVTQNNCDQLDDLFNGMEVNVRFNIRGRKWEKNGQINYFNTLQAWSVKRV